MTYLYVGHDSFAGERHTSYSNGVPVTHSYEGHDSFIKVTWLIYKSDMTHSQKRDTHHIPTVYPLHIDGVPVTHSYVGHDSFIYGTWLIYMWDMTHSQERDTHRRILTVYVCMCDFLGQLYVGHIALWLNSIFYFVYNWVTSYIWMRIYIYIEIYRITTLFYILYSI